MEIFIELHFSLVLIAKVVPWSTKQKMNRQKTELK